MKKNIIFSLVAGLLLYFLTMLSACLTCLDLSTELLAALLTAVFVLGTVIVLVLFIRNRASLKMQLISGFLWQILFWALLLLDATVGITRSLVAFPDDNLAGGLIIVLFWLSCTGLSAAGFLITAMAQLIRKFRKTT